MNKNSKKICVVTGSRSEYGLLRFIMAGIQQSQSLELITIATGMHLSPEFGYTVDVIELDGFKVDRKIEMLLNSDTAIGVTKSMGVGLIGFADALADLNPNLVLLLGDRYELFVAAIAATIARIPIAHVHGGETTEGSFDESIRHCISKMSHLHFVAAEEYRKRVIQLGENPEKVFCVGSMGIDSINRLRLLGRDELEKEINFQFRQRNLLITYHPVTLESETSSSQIDELLAVLGELNDIGLIFTMPNADTMNSIIRKKINNFCAHHTNAIAFTSLGQLRYYSCIQFVNGVVGNSSSVLIEVPFFKKGTVNIGDRQRGRLKANSIIDCDADRNSIRMAINNLFSQEFQMKLHSIINPYHNNGGSQAVIKILEEISLKNLLKKKFHDV